MQNWAFVIGALVGLVGCGSADLPPDASGVAGSVDLAGSAGMAPTDFAGSAGLSAEAGASGEPAIGGSAGSSVAGAGGAVLAGAGGTAGAVVGGGPSVAGAGGVAGLGGAPSSGGAGVAGVGGAGTAGAGAGGVAGVGGSSVAGAGGAAVGGSNSGGSAGVAGAPGTACPSHTALEAISTQAHTLTFTFPAYVNIVAADLAPLAGFTVIPFVDGVQSSKAFEAGSMWYIPPVNRMKTLSFTVAPNTTGALMPANGLALFCN